MGIALFIVAAAAAISANAAPEIAETPTGVRLTRGGRTVWNLEVETPEGRPFFHPLTLPGGRTLAAAFSVRGSAGGATPGECTARETKRLEFTDPATSECVVFEQLKAPASARFYLWPDKRMVNPSVVYTGALKLKKGETLELAYRLSVRGGAKQAARPQAGLSAGASANRAND